ncbi:hypothetical protein FRC04_003844 [Tulasnella sp. 424]|nr:hypothetical protein FRC04_003844 [Tulasnella sp. 424]KAG8975342.1 hypothetical protein FRC05_005901 [Tulasnella sp. 425]
MTKNNEAQSKLCAIEEALMYQICAGVMQKPYALSPYGCVCYLACLQEWFQSQRDNDDVIRSRPSHGFVVKPIVEALGIESEEDPAPLPGSAPTASAVSAVSDDPWHGIIADAEDYGEDDEEVEDYYIGHDEDDLDVFEALEMPFYVVLMWKDKKKEKTPTNSANPVLPPGPVPACGADFDLDGYCVGCGAPAEFGYSDEDEDEEDAASDVGPGSSPSSEEEVVWQDPMGSDIEYEEDDPGHAITEEDLTPPRTSHARPLARRTQPPQPPRIRSVLSRCSLQHDPQIPNAVRFDSGHLFTSGASVLRQCFFEVHYDRDSEDEDRVGRVELVGH